jgi:hypothetical protein
MDYFIRDIDSKPLRNITNIELCPRDLLFYLWLTHYRPVSSGGAGIKLTPQQDILKWIGTGMSDTIDVLIDENGGELHGIVWVQQDQDGRPCYAIQSDCLSQIGQSLEENYHILQAIPHLGLTGRDYVRYINKNPERLGLRDLITEGLRELFSRARHDVIRIDAIDNDAIQISDSGRSWVFLIVVHPTQRALTKNDMTALLPIINSTRVQVAGNFEIADPSTICVLLLAPDTEDVGAAAVADNAPRVYHLWALGAVRFFHMLNELLGTFDQNEIAARLDNIFPEQVISSISELKMIERLKEPNRLHKKK